MSTTLTAAQFDLSQQDVEKVFSSISIPTCPAVVSEVMAEMEKEDPDIRRVAESIAADPGMVAVTLKLANSPLFRAGGQTSSIQHALERLGTRNINCVVIASALRSAMEGVASKYLAHFWSRASSLAMAAGLIARRQFGVAPDAAYTYALFHNAGQPLMMQRYPEYEKVLAQCRRDKLMVHQVEGQYFPCTHPVIGALLVRNWGLPSLVGQAIRFHHEPDLYDLPDKTLPGGAVSLIAVTHIAEYLSLEMDQEPDLEVGDAHFTRALAYFGIDSDELDALREIILTARGS
ncbi:HDOD domain-containing protein [Chitinibacter fontanus]|uniref:HDOD domain-containing protein n=1 Tax=Chitinibacter fontanus TaxID=1737446 RepID=A0A7D5VAB2_9NEIS|nr:HDOD domain-containing protein [Chitinibacter fontanus]QLI81652.1 HDOD domain-containing protein [Chitinibacter fontanus]